MVKQLKIEDQKVLYCSDGLGARWDTVHNHKLLAEGGVAVVERLPADLAEVIGRALYAGWRGGVGQCISGCVTTTERYGD
jgi:hypothetical protein